MPVERVAECSWNQWPNERGIRSWREAKAKWLPAAPPCENSSTSASVYSSLENLIKSTTRFLLDWKGGIDGWPNKQCIARAHLFQVRVSTMAAAGTTQLE
jgi:hypothetical protein